MLLVRVADEDGVADFAAHSGRLSQVYSRKQAGAGAHTAFRTDGNGAAKHHTFLHFRLAANVDGPLAGVDKCAFNVGPLLDKEAVSGPDEGAARRERLRLASGGQQVKISGDSLLAQAENVGQQPVGSDLKARFLGLGEQLAAMADDLAG